MLSHSPHPGGRHVLLLRHDPALAAHLTDEQLAAATPRLRSPLVALEPGTLTEPQMHETPGLHGAAHGFLVLSGLMSADLLLDSRTTSRLVYPGNLVLLDGGNEDSMETFLRWSVLADTEIAILDDRLLDCFRHWPELAVAFHQRAAAYARDGLLQQAISQFPNVEDRILALLWSIADRNGVVRRDGVFVAFDVSHESIAQMVGARRPTISLGLAAVVDRGDVTPVPGGFLISPESVDRFAHHAGVEPSPTRPARRPRVI